MDIRDLLREIQADTLTLHGHALHCEERSIQGWWDRGALKRAVENLISNAIKYGCPHTPVTVRTDEVHERLMLSVHNEGDPIPADEQECIFQMYRRAESAKNSVKQGWGIGLPYVRAVAESHGGSIGVDSGAGRGTTFIIDIPLDGRLFRDALSLELGPH
jgi:signal transduction histidine kinase